MTDESDVRALELAAMEAAYAFLYNRIKGFENYVRRMGEGNVPISEADDLLPYINALANLRRST